jgi:predicted exporter
MIAAVLLTITCAVAATHLRLALTVDRLEPDIPAVAVQKEIARQFHLPEETLFVLASGPALDPLLELNERLSAVLAANGALPIESPAMFIPSERSQRQTLSRVGAAGLTADRVRQGLATAGRDAGFRDGSFEPFVSRLPALLDPGERLTLDGYRAHGLGDLLSRFVTVRDGVATTVAYISAASPGDIDRVERAVRAIGAPLRLTGLALVNRELEAQFRPDFLMGAALGIVGVALLLAIGFGGLRLVPLALLPTALGVLWSVGLLSLAGVSLDLFSAFALLASIGVGVDYSVHVLYRRKTRPERGMIGAITDVTPALVLAAATAVVGFGSLATSSYAPLRLFGLVSALTIASCLAASVIVLPALLSDRR